MEPMVKSYLDSTHGGNNDRGIMFSLTLERVSHGEGVLYPAARMALMRRWDRWLEAENAVRQWAAREGFWPQSAKFDVRWDLRSEDRKPLPLVLDGGSIGGAFGCGLSQLLR